jgi:predicted  nucleic acid-binding Zn-ribbon protein
MSLCAHRRVAQFEEDSVKAAHVDQLRLLDVAALDTRITQLDHKSKTLPEHTKLRELNSQLPIAADAAALLGANIGDLDREIARIEGEVEQVRARVSKDRDLLEGGTASAQVLESLQHELETLARRQAELEDAELVVLEQAETLNEQRASALAVEAELLTTREQVEAALAAAVGEITSEKNQIVEERSALVAALPAELISLYDKVRADVGGAGAAMLQHKRCLGCQMEQTPTEINRLRAAADDEVLRCDECRRILVRTSESGL